MLRTICLVTALLLLLGLSQISVGHQAVPNTTPVVVADGPDPMPPPLPLAQPTTPQPLRLLADGPDPMPPPLPLEQPLRLLADGPDPMPPPLPLAAPTSVAA